MPSPLKSSRLRRILVAYTVNRLGTWFCLVALLLAVFGHTHSAIAIAALLFAWQALPAFVVPAVAAIMTGTSPQAYSFTATPGIATRYSVEVEQSSTVSTAVATTAATPARRPA